MTQAERLIVALRRGWHSWQQLLDLHISNAPWARLISEGGLRHLREGERLERRERADGLVEMRVVKG